MRIYRPLLTSRYALPPTNLIPASDLTNAYWTKTSFDASGAYTLRENTNTTTHALKTTNAITRTAAVRYMHAQADVYPTAGRTACALLTFDNGFTANISLTNTYNFVTGLVNSCTTGSGWAGGAGTLTKLQGSNGWRITADWITDGATTGTRLWTQLYQNISTATYAGVATEGCDLRNLYVYETNPLAPITQTVDGSAYKKGVYSLTLSASNKGSYVQNVDFFQTALIVPGTFPNGLRTQCIWPDVTAPNGIYATYSVSYGVYIGGSVPNTAVTAKQISGITTCTGQYAISIEGIANSMNAFIDLYLTTVTGDDGAHRAFEVGVFARINTTARTYYLGKTHIGDYTDANSVIWKCYEDTSVSPPNIVFFTSTGNDLAAQTVDLKAFFTWLGTQSVSGWSTSNWINGFGLVHEPVQGRSAMNVYTWVGSLT